MKNYPKKMYKMLEEKRNNNYNPVYTEEMILKQQNMKKETISMISLLYISYWCENEEELKELKKKIKENEQKSQK